MVDWPLLVFAFAHQVQPTVVPPQTKTAQYLQFSSPMTPLWCSTWKLTPPSTTHSPWWESPTSKPWCSRSRKSRSSLTPPWCLVRARCQRDQTPAWSLAAILSVAPSPAAASVDGAEFHMLMRTLQGRLEVLHCFYPNITPWTYKMWCWFCNYALLLSCVQLTFQYCSYWKVRLHNLIPQWGDDFLDFITLLHSSNRVLYIFWLEYMFYESIHF